MKISFNAFVPRWVWIALPVFATVTIGLRHSIIKKNIESHRYERESQRVLREVDVLQGQVAQLRSPRRLENLAKKQFNLLPPRANQWIQIQESSTTPLRPTNIQNSD